MSTTKRTEAHHDALWQSCRAGLRESVLRPNRLVKLIYISGPFRGLTAYDIHRNITAAEDCGFRVIRAGGFPVIPHLSARHFYDLRSAAFWDEGTLALLNRCDAILMLMDWERSIGACGEREWAQQAKIPIFEEQGDAGLTRLRVWIEGRIGKVAETAAKVRRAAR